MLLASDPDQTFAIGLSEGSLVPVTGEPAFCFRFMTARELREYRAWGSDIEGRLQRPDNEVSEELFDRIRKKLVRCSNLLVGEKPSAQLEDHLAESEAWTLFWRMCAANRLGPAALKNFESPSPISSDESAAATAGNAQTPQTPSNPPSSSAPSAPGGATGVKPAAVSEPSTS